MHRVLVVAIGGALGSVARYLMGGVVQQLVLRWVPSVGLFPSGTVAVNLLGSFLMGLVMQLGADAASMSPTMKLALTSGFLGGFTTWSAFAFETVSLAQGFALRTAVANVAVSLFGGLAACWAGIALARQLAS
jgi:CrcB protein